ncbi:CHC2 zinc finger domain-containing protein [Dyella sp. C9]|uniref:CHC2 zinc finger domain-containing protein n=1 Tax=Dyella sp. C9 TaxID=2202154 RepID=UPI000DEF5FAA|nr:CHC2 zinc finger domain-containing protein [Dyella sp. C9]
MTSQIIDDLILPNNWRKRLPRPMDYYPGELKALRQTYPGGIEGHCPFCEDRHRALKVDLRGTRGHWCCFACDRMGDIVDFHHLKTGLSYELAALSLMEMR